MIFSLPSREILLERTHENVHIDASRWPVKPIASVRSRLCVPCRETSERFQHGGNEPRLLDCDLSNAYLTAAWKQQCRSASAKVVLVSLADNHNWNTGQCNPSITTIAKRCDLSRQGVLNILKQLEQDGKIRVERRHRRSNKFTFLFPPSGQPRLPVGQGRLPKLVNPVDSNRNGTIKNPLSSANKWKGEPPKGTMSAEQVAQMMAQHKERLFNSLG